MNEVSKKLRAILDQPMDRREFLQHIGLLFLGVIGITALIRHFSQPSPLSKDQFGGYGMSGYGGSVEGL